MRVTYSHLYRLVAIVLCLLLTPLPTLSQGTSSSQAAGQISALVPQATRNGSPASVKEDVMWNDLLRTEGAGRARITLKDGSLLSLGSNTELKVVQHDAAAQQTVLELNYGRVRSNVMKITKPGGKFEVKTSAAVSGVVGTDFIVIYEGGHMQVVVISGVVQVIGLNGVVLAVVNPGQMVDLVNGQVIGPVQTPPSVQTTNISQTNPGSGAGGGAGGGAGAGAGAGAGVGASSLLHTVLVVIGVAAASSAVTVATGHAPSSTSGPTGTPCPDSPARRANRRGGSCTP